MTLLRWDDRPAEEANLFNPAFCGALICEFSKAYQSARPPDTPIALVSCAIPVALHPLTRENLPHSIITSLYSWLEENPQVLIGFADRARNLVPVLNEALRFLLDRETISIAETGNIVTGRKSPTFSQGKMEELTHDTRDCVHAARKLGRWFARAGAPSTILSGWGIRL